MKKAKYKTGTKYKVNKKRVARQLDALGHTQYWLFDKMQISYQTYYNWTSAGTNEGRLMQLAAVLGCKPADLV